MSTVLISVKTRQAFREYMVSWVLRKISNAFDAAQIDCDLSYNPNEGGERRRLIEQYYHIVDWTDLADVRKVLQVFETVLYELAHSQSVYTPEWHKAEMEKFGWLLKKDGYQWMDEQIVPISGMPLLAGIKATAVVFDAKHMTDQIRRMELSVEADPDLAIGTAKELIETCCKTILRERGKTVEGTPDIPTLTKETLKELKLVPEGIPESARGVKVIKTLLSNLGTIGNGLAELRGLYGTGHGKDGNSVGLKPRHAKLAVGASAALAVFLFETHQDTKSYSKD